MLKIFSLCILFHYLFVVLPAPHGVKFDEEQQAKPAHSIKHYIVKPRAKSLGLGSLDIDQNIAVAVLVPVVVTPCCITVEQKIGVIIPKTFNAFNPRAPPGSFPIDHIWG